MGKLVGVAGSLRGKIGTFVFSKGENGESYAKAYQPQVRNPRTDGQLSQRAKINLVGQISQAVPKSMLVGMGWANPRHRRSVFNRSLIEMTEVTHPVGGDFVATLDARGIQFSSGSEVLRASVSTGVTLAASGVTIGLTLNESALAGAYGERVIVGVITPESKPAVAYFVDKVVIFDDQTELSVKVDFPQEISADDYVVMYRIPFVLSEEGIAIRTESIAADRPNIESSLLASGNGVKVWGKTFFQYDAVFTAA